MTDLVKFPFQNDSVRLDEAIEFIAKVADSESPASASKKRISSIIRYALKIGEISLARTAPYKTVDTASFFTWASSKWPELNIVEGLPRNVCVTITGVSGSFEIGSLAPMTIPSDIETLKKVYQDCEAERQRLLSENEQLRSKLAKCDSELSSYKEKEKERKLKSSEAGKRGKGVPRRER